LKNLKTESPKTEKPQTTITCKGHLDMSYGKNVAVFNEDVVVNDPRMKMKADKMKVFFEPETRAIEKVIATGHVRFKKEDKTAKSRKAVYTAKDGRVVLTGKPMVKKGGSIMTGEMITFFRDDSRMLIEPTAKLIFYTEDQEEFKEGWMK
jgi:lipopolysaccharide export system protein LptA